MNSPTTIRATSLLVFLLLGWAGISGARGIDEELEYARRLHQDGIHDLAAEQCRQLRERFPESERADELLDLEARSWFALARWDEARSAWQRLSLGYEQSMRAAEAQRMTAVCLDSLGRVAEAARAWRRFAQRFPDNPEAAQGMLQAYGSWPQEDVSARRGLLEELLQRWPQSVEALEGRFQLARLELEAGNETRARTGFERVLSEPGSRKLPLRARALLDLVTLVEAVEGPRAARAVLAGSGSDLPPDWSLRIALAEARLLLLESRPAEALDRVSAGVVPLDGGPMLEDSLSRMKGAALAALGRHEEAAQQFAGLHAPGQDDRMSSAWCLGEAGDRAAALAAWLPLLEELSRGATGDADRLVWSLEHVLSLGPATEIDQRLAEQITQRMTDSASLEIPLGWIEWLLEQDRNTLAARLLDSSRDNERTRDERMLLRLRLALKQEQWDSARRQLEILRAECPLSPLLANAGHLERDILKPREQSAVLQETLLDLMVRQGAGEDPARMALEFGRLYLWNMQRPAEAKPQFQKALAGLRVDSLSAAAAYGLLRCSVAQGDTTAVLEVWATHGELLQRHWTVLPSLKALWSLSEQPGMKAALERLRVLSELSTSGSQVPDAGNALLELGLAALAAPSSDAATRDSLAAFLLRVTGRQPQGELALAVAASAQGLVGNQEAALPLWRKLRTNWPDSRWRVRADLEIAADASTDDAERLGLLDELRLEHPYHPALDEVEELRAGLLFRSGRMADALAVYQGLGTRHAGKRVLPLMPEEGSRYEFQIAMCHEKLGDHEAARMAWSRFLRGAGSRDRERGEEAMLSMAASWARQGDSAQAILLCRNLLGVAAGRPVAARARQLLANQLDGQGRHDEAGRVLAALNPAASPDPVLRAAWIRNLYHNASFNKAKGEFSRMLKEFKDQIDTDTLKASMNYAKGSAQLQAGNLDGSEKSFSLVVKEFAHTPYGAPASYSLARSRAATGETQAAIDTIDDLLQRWPDAKQSDPARLLKGRLLYESGDSRSGMRALRELAEGGSDEGLRRQAYDLLIRVYREEGFPDGALQALQRYLREFPDAPDHFTRRMEATLLRKDLGDLDGAAAAIRELLPGADTERAAALQFYLGECLQQSGQLQAAILEYLKVPYLGGETKLDWDVTALYQAGQCWEELGDPERAFDLYVRIIRLRGPGSTFGNAAQERINLLRSAGALPPEDRKQP